MVRPPLFPAIIGMPLLISGTDFPGAGEDEIAFQRGETIVVIAKDDGFGDGWWTVIPPFSNIPVYISVLCYALVAFHLVSEPGAEE